ncbi:MAG: adenylate/guanylate cyclase domain-containing protein [Sneathiellaceae bacterium]
MIELAGSGNRSRMLVRMIDWLLDQSHRDMPTVPFFSEFCQRLSDEGVPLARVVAGLPAVHPQHFARGLEWTRSGDAREITREHGILDTALYRESPVALIHRTGVAIRRRLCDPATPMDFPILHELKAEGITDYLVMPLEFSRGVRAFISWSSDCPEGFTADQLGVIYDIMPIVSLRLELRSAYRMAEDLLNTYLGSGAARQVLSGTVQRGQGHRIRAAIWYCDLRDYTAMAERMRSHELIVTLDDFFECLAGPIQDHGGEVLKFMGDGLLAIFRLEDSAEGDEEAAAAAACHRALSAVRAAFERLHVLNQGRGIGGAPPLRLGLALHLGEVIYGNIGAQDRLDFTVIGPAVNTVARLEELCKALNLPVLASAEFAGAAGVPMQDMGSHPLRGLRRPLQVFAVPPEQLAGQAARSSAATAAAEARVPLESAAG